MGTITYHRILDYRLKEIIKGQGSPVGDVELRTMAMELLEARHLLIEIHDDIDYNILTATFEVEDDR